MITVLTALIDGKRYTEAGEARKQLHEAMGQTALLWAVLGVLVTYCLLGGL